jgi:tetratricopeptide (TPR) repeat protein
MGDPSGAKDALRAALSFEGENADALKKLAELCLVGRDFRGAAEALIRLARVRKDREELRWVFFTLGNIYDENMPDSRRAEAAYRRVLKLIPSDLEAMERLATLYETENNLDKSVEMLKLLIENVLDPDESREYRLRLSSTLEKRGDLRGAEAVLEQTRKNAPVDLVVLRGLADLYERQNAPQALSMHLNRAVADFRQAIETDSTDSAAWVGLVEVLTWRGRPDSARVIASAATTVGIQSDQLSHLLDAGGGVPGAGVGASSDELDELLASRTIPRAARSIFEMANDAFDKVLPYDGRAVRAEKVAPRNNTWAAAGKDVARWFGIGEPQIQVTNGAPRVCVPVGHAPFTVLVGSDIYDKANEREKRFLLARAAKMVASHLVVPARSQPRDLALTIAGLIRSYDPMYTAAGFDPAELDGAARRIAKAIGRKLRDPLQPLVIEMAGAKGFDPARLGLMACELGDRAALLSTGALPAAVSALLRLAGRDDISQIPGSQRVDAIRRVTEARDLYEFAMSDMHFEARKRAGADGA